MGAKAGDNNNGLRKWKFYAWKWGESGNESILGLEYRRNQIFDVAYFWPWPLVCSEKSLLWPLFYHNWAAFLNLIA